MLNLPATRALWLRLRQKPGTCCLLQWLIMFNSSQWNKYVLDKFHEVALSLRIGLCNGFYPIFSFSIWSSMSCTLPSIPFHKTNAKRFLTRFSHLSEIQRGDILTNEDDFFTIYQLTKGGWQMEPNERWDDFLMRQREKQKRPLFWRCREDNRTSWEKYIWKGYNNNNGSWRQL